MVVIALLLIVGLSTADTLVTNQFRLMDPWILLPATVILFREVFVSGLREFLGSNANTLQVTRMAKYKTTVQMLAIAVLFAKGIFEHYFLNMVQGMDIETYDAVMAGTLPDVNGVLFYWTLMKTTWSLGVVLLFAAAVLTFVTGWDYFSKARPFLRETKP
jgi:CDP-diacylglycerol--glycerol-3-phosphate 3-phosphatidyltransferase